ncbi:SET domain-containing protein 4 [Schistocerca piceifrons]|uniref:SET domain-containing protein 4 n=1 Tax=Schistocerca piceifrons TaxID=274613 RepID=UPI001F5FF1B9|nr:SET domain-containing protein 4 [Schistocerca piceifrons]
MGRTRRSRRRRKISGRCSRIDYQQELRTLGKWLRSQGWNPNCKLRVADFDITGRGLMAGVDIKSGDKIMSIPCDILLTTNTVNLSDVGCLFHGTDNMFSAQEVLATFLLWERQLGYHSKWFPYLDTLPPSFSTPVFCADDEIKMLHNHLLDAVVSQKQEVKDSFHRISDLISTRKTCTYCDSNKFLDRMETFFTVEAFMWAWYVVNTRSIFYPVPLVTSRPSIKIKDKNCMALAPFLDLFNHSYDAVVDIEMSQNSYDIISRSCYSKYSQVFINYGPHSNMKLFLEYGFIIPCNPHDSVDLTLEDLVDAVKRTKGIECICSGAKYDYLLSHKLLENIFLCSEGLSFNARAAIYILISPEASKLGYKSVYSSEFSKEEMYMLCMTGKKLVSVKRVEYQTIFGRMIGKETNQCTSSFQVAKDLVTEYLTVLDKCEVSLSEMCQD